MPYAPNSRESEGFRVKKAEPDEGERGTSVLVLSHRISQGITDKLQCAAYKSSIQGPCRLSFSVDSGGTVVARCANPACSASFDSLQQGQVLVLSSDHEEHRVSSRVNFSGQIDHVTYVWLCDSCLSKFEFLLGSNGKVRLRAKFPHYGERS